ncbi:fluoride efflux transporter FluC [Bailinhaonella thermotolerans]|uniref:Fluoride-specific ion channel FluC n=1 Tax=Bailinhaonella thermotolerans TaxID=1070861 RepID=A0A3A4B039_9ACTN|nr:CrcB family protein [Bailinhaonella thermotolerans]RJL27268.1 CrcB family protein [Bailinhaonella thermotolerans]
MNWVLVALGAAAGAPARYLIDLWVRSRRPSVFPWGTFAVNVGGSALAGALSAALLGEGGAALLVTGFCGALTTYSTLAHETVALARARAWAYAVLNMAATLAVGLGAAALGGAVVRALAG